MRVINETKIDNIKFPIVYKTITQVVLHIKEKRNWNFESGNIYYFFALNI